MSKNKCPHCGFEGITDKEKEKSSYGFPYKCVKCGDLSYVKTPWFELPMIIISSTLAPVIVMSLFVYFWRTAAGFVVIMAIYGYFWKRNKEQGRLVSVSEEPSVPSKTLMLGVIIACSFVAVILVGIANEIFE